MYGNDKQQIKDDIYLWLRQRGNGWKKYTARDLSMLITHSKVNY